MAELLLQGLRWVWVGLQSRTHYGVSPLLTGLQKGPALAWAVYIPQGSQAQLHREVGWLAAHLLSPGMIGSVGILLLSLLELGQHVESHVYSA